MRHFITQKVLVLCWLIIAFSAHADDVEVSDSVSCSYSGSLPVLFIDTENNEPVVSKEYYLKAVCYLDTLSLEGYEPMGSMDEPVLLQIKGRGNASWLNSEKKPYRLKFENKQELLGMNANKHFALIAHVGAYTQFLTEAAGFELGRMIGLPWTPEMKPLELVLNGEYRGIYFLTEHIRVDKNRVNIHEQDDSCVVADEITGGWLVEIDNYTDLSQIVITEGNGVDMRITHKSPELLSKEQDAYLRNQFVAMDSLIYQEDKTSSLLWDKYMDLEYLVKYYIVQEILDNADAWHGSTYLHKDLGDDKKWVFGPLWDLGYSFWREQKDFLYESPKYATLTWIGEIAKYPAFQDKVREVWNRFYGERFPRIYGFIDDFAALCADADRADAARWPQYNKGETMSKRNKLKRMLQVNTEWLNEQWGRTVIVGELSHGEDRIEISIDRNGLTLSQIAESVLLYDMTGQPLHVVRQNGTTFNFRAHPGIYIVKIMIDNRSYYKKVLIR